jgi:hypothetical protein
MSLLLFEDMNLARINIKDYFKNNYKNNYKNKYLIYIYINKY